MGLLRAKDRDGIVHDVKDDPQATRTICGEVPDPQWDLDWEIDDDAETNCPKCLALRTKDSARTRNGRL
jgi:hypothetical protein